jgi:mannose/fructose-specific phosphotransferase system component IIA
VLKDLLGGSITNAASSEASLTFTEFSTATFIKAV